MVQNNQEKANLVVWAVEREVFDSVGEVSWRRAEIYRLVAAKLLETANELEPKNAVE